MFNMLKSFTINEHEVFIIIYLLNRLADHTVKNFLFKYLSQSLRMQNDIFFTPVDTCCSTYRNDVEHL